MSGPVRWKAGDDAVCRGISRWLADPATTTVLPLSESPRRILHRVELDEGTELRCVVKRHRIGRGRQRLREAIKSWLGRDPVRREWRALCRLHALGLAVPRPLAWGRLVGGDGILVSEWCDGTLLRSVLVVASAARRTALLERLAEAVEALHRAGFQHGDLHAGNILVEGDRLTLLDLQRTRRLRRQRSRLLDLARLELSLERAGTLPEERLRLRRRLGVAASLDPMLRRFLRDHLRGRSRRKLRVGRNLARVRIEDPSGIALVGLRDVSCDAALDLDTPHHAPRDAPPRDADRLAGWLAQAAASDEAEIRRSGRGGLHRIEASGRRWLLKRTDADGFGRALADRLRGSGAARAFATAQRLTLIAPIACRALAFVDQRRAGLPRRSWLLLESVGDEDLDRFRPASSQEARACARALGAWLAERHAWGLQHRDLKASNLRVTRTHEGFRFWWIDLEDVRIGRRVRESARVRALAQLNASLDDEAFSADARHAAFEAYHERLPFESDVRRILRQIVWFSLARSHRWRGEDCDVAQTEARTNRRRE